MTLIRRDEPITAALTITAIVVALASVVSLMFLPKVPVSSKRATDQSIARIRDLTTRSRTNAETANAQVAGKMWSGQAQQIGPAALQWVTHIVDTHRLKLDAFRPQRTIVGSNYSQLPFLISVNGPYLDVLAFTKDLETSNSRLAINIVQIASADPSSDQITANIGVIAYLKSGDDNGKGS